MYGGITFFSFPFSSLVELLEIRQNFCLHLEKNISAKNAFSDIAHPAAVGHELSATRLPHQSRAARHARARIAATVSCGFRSPGH